MLYYLPCRFCFFWLPCSSASFALLPFLPPVVLLPEVEAVAVADLALASLCLFFSLRASCRMAWTWCSVRGGGAALGYLSRTAAIAWSRLS